MMNKMWTYNEYTAYTIHEINNMSYMLPSGCNKLALPNLGDVGRIDFQENIRKNQLDHLFVRQ